MSSFVPTGPTGDVSNAFERLRRLLPKIRYHRPLDAVQACAGAPEALLPVLHYALLEFSHDIARHISACGYELMGKTDARFVQECFRMLGDVFEYHPSVSAKQFLARGFAERKLNLVADTIRLVIEKKKRLAAPAPTARRMSVHTPSPTIIRTVGGEQALQEPAPSPRADPPPVPAAKATVQTDDRTLDLITTLAARLDNLEAGLQTSLETINAKLVILEGRVRFLEFRERSPTKTPELPAKHDALERPEDDSPETRRDNSVESRKGRSVEVRPDRSVERRHVSAAPPPPAPVRDKSQMEASPPDDDLLHSNR